MTRSQKAPSRREQFNKTVRTKAQGEGITFRDAVTKTKAAMKDKSEDTLRSETERRNPGRNDGDLWNGRQFITSQQVGDRLLGQNEDVYDDTFESQEASAANARQARMTVNILDIARPAKRKGVAKHYEVIPKARPVLSIASEGDDFDLISNVSTAWLDDDAWEDLYEGCEEAPLTYSNVLRGG